MRIQCPALLVLLSLLTDTSQAQRTNLPATSLAELQKQLSNHVSQPRFAAALWGVKVVSLDSGKTLFEHNPEKLFSPASNSKLYTVAMALDRLGADYRIKTSLYAESKPEPDGTLKGDLIVYGRGDPTLNARLRGNDIHHVFDGLIAALTNAGVKQITGSLVGDETFFTGPGFGSGWSWDDLEYYYGAEITALTVNDNTLQVAVKPGASAGQPCRLELIPPTPYLVLSNCTETIPGRQRRTINFYRPLEQNLVYVTGQMGVDDTGYTEDVTVHTPGSLFVTLFQEALTRAGIKVAGPGKLVSWVPHHAPPVDCSKLTELGVCESLPMADIAREVMKPSQNLYTDVLLAHVGEQHRQSSTPREREQTSENLGLRELSVFLSGAGVKAGDVLFEEGSGLSRNNLTTPNATVALLQYMSRHKAAQVYRDALPIAGVDGTLRNRMKGTAAAGNVRAKTGTLRWANSLSGYVTSAAGEHLAFSVMLNRYHNPEPSQSARGDIDGIAVMLAEFAGDSRK
ncbi:MAG TPA: D-alanyl-D-alanine carboxypeptidase/D-alanyl-D-alanine-endopeptidase [Candidatus Dormibacteraeota bacterium]|nr:D-alanyl-D-alanine carboxypeptidase/D-alanyl-D-alanine-endopeptidase [Candidatus Dormibacteraeota bacterium]